jgi:hypothetical protein
MFKTYSRVQASSVINLEHMLVQAEGLKQELDIQYQLLNMHEIIYKS